MIYKTFRNEHLSLFLEERLTLASKAQVDKVACKSNEQLGTSGKIPVPRKSQPGIPMRNAEDKNSDSATSVNLQNLPTAIFF